jgi:hypothetical protein
MIKRGGGDKPIDSFPKLRKIMRHAYRLTEH